MLDEAEALVLSEAAFADAIARERRDGPSVLLDLLGEYGVAGTRALLRGLDARLRHETGMPVHVAEDPLSSVAMGAGKCVEEFEGLQQVLVSERRRY